MNIIVQIEFKLIYYLEILRLTSCTEWVLVAQMIRAVGMFPKGKRDINSNLKKSLSFIIFNMLCFLGQWNKKNLLQCIEENITNLKKDGGYKG